MTDDVSEMSSVLDDMRLRDDVSHKLSKLCETEDGTSSINGNDNPEQPASVDSGEAVLNAQGDYVGQSTRANNHDLSAVSDHGSDGNSIYGDAESDQNENIDSNLNEDDWNNQKKQIFILSESGKPIYSRYGRDDKLVTLCGLLVTLVSHVSEDGDELQRVEAGGHVVTFLARPPLVLVAVDHHSPARQLHRLLSVLGAQLEVVSTRASLVNAFSRRANVDLRALTGGSNRLLDSLATFSESDPCLLLASDDQGVTPYQCLPLPSATRAEVSSAIVSACSKVRDVVFAVVVAGSRVVTTVRKKGSTLHPDDLLLLCNLVNSTDSLRSSQHWMPICLPHVSSSGFLYAHVSYMSDACDACLFLMTVRQDYFVELSAVRTKIVDKLQRQNTLEKLMNTPPPTPYLNPPTLPLSPDPDDATTGGGAGGGLDVRHFVYHQRSLHQYVAGPPAAPYTGDPAVAVRLLGRLHARLHAEAGAVKLVYTCDPLHAALGWVTDEWELLVLLEPLVSRQAAMVAVHRVLKWVKQEEARLFMPALATF